MAIDQETWFREINFLLSLFDISVATNNPCLIDIYEEGKTPRQAIGELFGDISKLAGYYPFDEQMELPDNWREWLKEELAPQGP